MDETQIFGHLVRAMSLVLWLSMPAVAVAALVGTVVSLLQALTQIQEQTLGYAFKVIAVALALAMTVRWIGVELLTYSVGLFELIPVVGR